jgi:uncharacterized protein
MMPEQLTDHERRILLEIASQSIVAVVCNDPLPSIEIAELPARLQENGTAFVTLTIDGALRGCIGALEPHQPLALDVREHAIAAALHDFRFLPVRPNELDQLKIEISCLTQPIPLEYNSPDELLELLKPHVDGVVLRDGRRRATFLPQVWEKIPDSERFLGFLCQKLGDDEDLWRRKNLEVFIYQVEEFCEGE